MTKMYTKNTGIKRNIWENVGLLINRAEELVTGERLRYSEFLPSSLSGADQYDKQRDMERSGIVPSQEEKALGKALFLSTVT